MPKYFTLILALLSPLSMAETVTTPAASVPVIIDGNMGKRVCYYQDQAYSEGALLQVGELYMVCQAANKFETNGQLKWVQLNNEQKKPQ
ncbi:DUF1496 domain-containing protein [Vibrio ziniensis]|uniref:YnjH family protein n=1 Tax=Vibrio ziniensis TaxID=2711221 RepID=A0A6G7CH11_9VIBR|nr:DUF1496 domain-containing protein [Vibrio ziniensis]QIH41392.1 YnjH family protein [Vibrio ziniensis]